MTPKTKSTLGDILTGAIPFIITFTITSYFDVSYIYIFVSITSIIAGFIRGKQNLYEKIIKVILINCLYFIYILSLLSVMLHYAIIPVISVTGTYIGLYLRKPDKFSLIKPAILLFTYFTGVILLGFAAVPAFLRMIHWSEPQFKYSDFKLLDTKNDTIYSKSLNSKVIVMDFWTTWCGPCVKSFPVMQEVYNKYRHNDKVEFLFINTGQQDTKEKAINFISSNHYDLPFAFDIKQQTSKSYNIIGIPQIIIIDKKSVPRFIHRGYDRSSLFKEDLIMKIDSLLGEN